MIRHHYIAVLTAAALALGSCATAPTLRAAWYQSSEAKYVDEVSSVDTGPFVIAVRNYGSKDVQIHGIRLSPSTKKAFTSLPDFKSATNGAVALPPGGILTIDLAKDDTDPANGDVPPCTLPLAIDVQTGDQKKPSRIALGGLPSFLTEDFEACNADYWRKPRATNSNPPAGTAPSAVQR